MCVTAGTWQKGPETCSPGLTLHWSLGKYLSEYVAASPGLLDLSKVLRREAGLSLTPGWMPGFVPSALLCHGPASGSQPMHCCAPRLRVTWAPLWNAEALSLYLFLCGPVLKLQLPWIFLGARLRLFHPVSLPVPIECLHTGLWPGNLLPKRYLGLSQSPLYYPQIKDWCPELPNVQGPKVVFLSFLYDVREFEREMLLLNIECRLTSFFFPDFKDVQFILASNVSFENLSVNKTVISFKIVCSFQDFSLSLWFSSGFGVSTYTLSSPTPGEHTFRESWVDVFHQFWNILKHYLHFFVYLIFKINWLTVVQCTFMMFQNLCTACGYVLILILL